MIQANELRIGNWVNALHKFYQVTEIKRDQIGLGIVHTSHNETNAVLIDPVHINSEILEHSGFTNNNGKWYCKYKELNVLNASISHPSYSNGLWQLQIGINEAFNVNFSYLHQLQNLYFALTGEELEVHILEMA